MEDNAEPKPTPLPFSLPYEYQITKRIIRFSSYKAPGNDGIPNIVLESCVDIIAPILLKCSHTIIRLKYFPSTWREWTTVVI
jgi:hypothetical protein